MRKAARMVEIAFAPIAGAKGGELLFAPSVQAVPMPISVARTTNPQAVMCWLRAVCGGDRTGRGLLSYHGPRSRSPRFV